MPILERIVADDVEVLYLVSRLGMWASRHGKELEYDFEKEKGNVSYVILVDKKEEVRCTERYRGHASRGEVGFMAAEQALSCGMGILYLCSMTSTEALGNVPIHHIDCHVNVLGVESLETSLVVCKALVGFKTSLFVGFDPPVWLLRYQ